MIIIIIIVIIIILLLFDNFDIINTYHISEKTVELSFVNGTIALLIISTIFYFVLFYI